MSDQDLVARRSRGVLLLLVAILAVVCFILLLIPEKFEPRIMWLAHIVAWIGVGAIVLASPFLLRSPEEIRVGPDGVRVKKWSDQIVSWDEIDRIEERDATGQRMLTVYLKNPEKFTVKKIGKWSADTMRKHGRFGELNLVVGPLTTKSHTELLAAVSQYCEIGRLR